MRDDFIRIREPFEPHIVVAQPADQASAAWRRRLTAIQQFSVRRDVVVNEEVEFAEWPDSRDRDGPLFGQLFSDEIRKWYLPEFVPIDGLDAAFVFAARQTDQVEQSTGLPFNVGVFSMTVRKQIPAAAIAWRDAAPDRVLREIQYERLEAKILVESQAADHTLILTPSQASIASLDADTYVVTAEAVLGVQVIALYQNLLHSGKARCVVSGAFTSCHVRPMPPLGPGEMGIMMLTYDVEAVPFAEEVAIASKYATDDYRLKYTITRDGSTRVIVNTDDLRNFGTLRSEFVELLALGDVSQRYPSIARLYFGVVTRTVIAVPARYVIARDAGMCAARCQALVDSTPGREHGSKFQFDFTLLPDVEDVDLLMIADELEARPEPELRGARVRLPNQFELGASATLSSAFITSFSYRQGATDPCSVALSAEIVETPDQLPSVVKANMVIAALRTGAQPFLTGSVGIRLDDSSEARITAPIVLNFAYTGPIGTAGLKVETGEGGAAKLRNSSSFDLFVKRVGILTSQGLVVRPVGETLVFDGTLDLEVSADEPDFRVIAECELALPQTLTTSQLFRLLQLDIVDVQNTQYLFSINASGVSFLARGIEQIGVSVALNDAPGVAVTPMLVKQGRALDSARVILPLASALADLAAVVAVDVSYVDPARPPVRLSLNNDFARHPIFSIADADLPQP